MPKMIINHYLQLNETAHSLCTGMHVMYIHNIKILISTLLCVQPNVV